MPFYIRKKIKNENAIKKTGFLENGNGNNGNVGNAER